MTFLSPKVQFIKSVFDEVINIKKSYRFSRSSLLLLLSGDLLFRLNVGEGVILLLRSAFLLRSPSSRLRRSLTDYNFNPLLPSTYLWRSSSRSRSRARSRDRSRERERRRFLRSFDVLRVLNFNVEHCISICGYSKSLKFWWFIT